jgi:hypothetical protein
VTLVVGVFLARVQGFGAVDDAFITLRYSANWGRGAGLVFNPGEVVEGFSTFLLVALQAGLVRVGLDPVVAMTLLGWGSLAALGATTFLFLGTHLVPRRPWVAAALTVALLANPMVVAWASSGMEPCLYATLVLWTLSLALDAGGPGGRPVGAALVLVLTAMTRLETLALTPALGLMVWWPRRSFAAALRYAATFTVVFGVYFALRAWHFGALFPNTFYVKVDYGNTELWRRGLLYVWDFFRSVPLLGILALAALPRIVRGPFWARGTLLLVGFQILAVVYVGGDHFALFRFLVPVLVPISALALYALLGDSPSEGALGWLWSRMPPQMDSPSRRRALPVGVALVVLAVSVLGAGDVHRRGDGIPDPAERSREEGLTQIQRYIYEADLARQWTKIGLALKAAVPSDATLCVITIGAIGYYSELPILDPYGLTEPAIGRQQRPLGEGYVGHEKYDVDYVLAQAPELFLLLNNLTERPLPEEALPRAVWGAFNKGIVTRPEFRARYDYVSLPVDGRYLNLHVRKRGPSTGGRFLLPTTGKRFESWAVLLLGLSFEGRAFS